MIFKCIFISLKSSQTS